MTAALTSVGTQQVTITIAAGSLTGTASISAVGSGAYLIDQGSGASDTVAQFDDTNCYLTISGTTITATRGVTGSSQTVTRNVTVVDGDTTNLIKSVQTGTVAITTTNTSGTASISAVTNANTGVQYLGETSSASLTTLSASETALSLATTTLTATRLTGTSATVTTGYCITEYQGTALNSSVQNINFSTSATGTSGTVTITGVTANNTTLTYSGQESPGSNPAAGLMRSTLTNTTTITVSWNTSTAAQRNYKCVVTELVAALLAQNIQRGTIALSAQTSNTATITSSPVAQTIANWLGNSSTQTTVDFAVTAFALVQTNATTLTMSVTSSASGTGSYEAINLNPVAANAVFVNWMASFDPTVSAPPAAAQFSFVAQKIQPSPIAQTDWYAFYEAQVNPPPASAQYSTVAEKELPSPITQNDWIPAYDPQVKPGPSAAQFSVSPSGKVLPGAISQTDWYAFFSPDVIAPPKNAQNTFIAQKVQPGAITRNDWYPLYPAEVKPAAANNIETAVAPIPAIITAFAPNGWYPAYDAQVPRPPSRSGFSLFAQTLLAPAIINNWYPAYAAEVKPAPAAAPFSTTGQLLPTPISLNRFYPSYRAEVSMPALNSTGFTMPPIPALAAVFTPIGWYPSYQAETKPAPANNTGALAQLPPSPISLLNWFPAYPDNVINQMRPAFGMMVGPLTLIITPPTPTPQPVSLGGPTRKKLEAQDSMSEAEMLAQIEAAERQRRDDDDAFILLF